MFCLVSLASVTCLINRFENTYVDKFAVSIMDKFGMAEKGNIKISGYIKGLNLTAQMRSYVVILVISDAQRVGWYGDLTKIEYICEQPSFMRGVSVGAGVIDLSYDTTSMDIYSVLILQCWPGIAASPMKLQITVTATNPTPNSNSKIYLAIQDVMLVPIFQTDIVLCVLLFIGLLAQFNFLSSWNSTTNAMYILFLGVISLKLCVVVSSYEYFDTLNKTGEVLSSVQVDR